jgi:hypothetical protein
MGVATDRAAEIKLAVADSEPKFVVTCVGGNAGPPAQARAWPRRLLSVRPDNVFNTGLVLSLTRRHPLVVARGALNHEGHTAGMFLSNRLNNVHLTAGGARSAQRTLAGEGVCMLPRDVEIVNRLKCEILSVTDFYSGGTSLASTTDVAASRDLMLRCWGARRNKPNA